MNLLFPAVSRSFIVILFAMLAFGCASNPKGEYSRSHIDRPYALPDDVASATVGLSASSIKLKEENVDAFTEIENSQASYVTPVIAFEQGIGDVASWIYPLGLKWEVWGSEKHTLGLSAATLIFYSTYSFNYWYRISDKVSLRPYFRSEQTNLIIFDYRQDLYGLDVIYQVTDTIAMKFNYGKGTFEGSSDVFDEALSDIEGSEVEDASVKGDVTEYGIGGIFSLSEYIDLRSSLYFEKMELDTFSSEVTSLDFNFVFFY